MNEIISQLRELLIKYTNDGDLAAYQAASEPLISKANMIARESNDLRAFSILAQYSSAYLQQQAQIKDKAEFAKTIQGLTGLVQGATDIARLGVAYDQIRTASRAGSDLPAIPTAPPPNAQLSEALFDAQRRAGDVGYAINPATEQLNLAYTQGLGQAQAASGGQASNYQAYANLLNQQRMQAALNLVPQAQQARLQNQGLVNQLLGLRIQEQQNQFQNQLQAAQPGIENYHLTQQAIGGLGSQGRSNLFDVVSRLPEYLNYLPYDDDTNNFIRGTQRRTNAINAGVNPFEIDPLLPPDKD
jgi:hypothetical protein